MSTQKTVRTHNGTSVRVRSVANVAHIFRAMPASIPAQRGVGDATARELGEVYARQVDELAAMVEGDAELMRTRMGPEIRDGLGALYVQLDELTVAALGMCGETQQPAGEQPMACDLEVPCPTHGYDTPVTALYERVNALVLSVDYYAYPHRLLHVVVTALEELREVLGAELTGNTPGGDR